MHLATGSDSDNGEGGCQDTGGRRDRSSDCTSLLNENFNHVADRPWLAGPPALLALAAGTLLLTGLVAWQPARAPFQALIGRNEIFGDAQHEAHPPKCASGDLPVIWGPNTDGEAMLVNVMSYNLFWWNLFDHVQGPTGHLRTQGNQATQLITKALQHTPYDLLGFTECEDEGWLVSHAGMSAEYTIFRDRACCMAYRKRLWTLLSRGVNYVADDAHFGMRPAQWMRLRNKATGKTVFFVNHHGPLPIGSGGMCGGYAHAFNLMKVFESHSVRGDTIILVGDFNSDPASQTIKLLTQKLHVVYGGWKSKTHIDYILSNVAPAMVVKSVDLGGGGSDHNALRATLRVGTGAAAPQKPQVVEGFMPQPDHKSPKHGLCSKEKEDRFEYGIKYVVARGSGRLNFQGLVDQEACCLKCHSMPKCKSFSFLQGGGCWVFGALPTEKQLEHGSVSGLPLRDEEIKEVVAEEIEESAEVRKEEEKTPTAQETPKASEPKAEYNADFEQLLHEEQEVQDDQHEPDPPEESRPALSVSIPAWAPVTPAPLPAPAPVQLAAPVQSSPAFHLSMPHGLPKVNGGGLAGFVSPLTSWMHR